MQAWAALGPVAALLLVAPAEAAPRAHLIVMEKMKFVSVPASVRRGDVILWENRAFNVDLAPGAKGRTVVRKAGAIAFVCKYHPGMRGVLKVVQ